jgi:hypothetical protein
LLLPLLQIKNIDSEEIFSDYFFPEKVFFKPDCGVSFHPKEFPQESGDTKIIQFGFLKI